MFKNTIERLNIENLALQEKHDMLVCSHNKFMDSHIMLEMAHEVVLTNLKSYQPHICTCTQTETILSLSGTIIRGTPKTPKLGWQPPSAQAAKA
jgi:hypothetical protein